MRYNDFEKLFDTWQGFQRAIHTLSPCHPMKKYCSGLIKKIQELPVQKQQEYFNKYYSKNNIKDF
jgi:secreted Zn-dependent insulinase-like peptidase